MKLFNIPITYELVITVIILVVICIFVIIIWGLAKELLRR